MDSSKPKIHDFSELSKHVTRGDCWLLIHDKVYNVSEFLGKHPGGDEVLLTSSEKDASDDFEEIAHSKEARELMKKYYIGDINPDTVPARQKYNTPVHLPKKPLYNPLLIKLLQLILPLSVLAIAFGARALLKR